MQEGNWGDIEKVFQKTHVYLWFIYHNITNSQAVLGIVVTPWFVATFNCYFLDEFLHPATPQLLSIIQKIQPKNCGIGSVRISPIIVIMNESFALCLLILIWFLGRIVRKNKSLKKKRIYRLLFFIGIWHFKIRVLRITICHVKIMIQESMFTISHSKGKQVVFLQWIIQKKH